MPCASPAFARAFHDACLCRYVTRFRNLAYLEAQLDAHHKREAERVEAANRALRRLQKKLREEEYAGGCRCRCRA